MGQSTWGFHFGLTLRNNQKTQRCVSVSRFMLARPVSRSVMRAGSCTAWSTASSPTDRCPPTRPSVVVMTRSTPSFPRLAPASTSHVPSSSIWSLPSSTRSAPVLTVSFSTPSSLSLVRRMPPTTTPVVTTPLARRSLTWSSTASESSLISVLSPGFPYLPLLRWWYRIRIRLPLDGASLRRLRQEVQVGVRLLPRAPGVDCRCRALQLHPHHPHHVGALGLRLHGRQRGHLRHLPSQPRHRAPHLHQLESFDRSDCLLNHRLPPIRRCVERGLDRVPDQLGALPPNPLPPRHLRPGHLGREGLPRAALGCRDHQRVLRARQPDGQVRPASRQVHGLLHVVPW